MSKRLFGVVVALSLLCPAPSTRLNRARLSSDKLSNRFAAQAASSNAVEGAETFEAPTVVMTPVPVRPAGAAVPAQQLILSQARAGAYAQAPYAHTQSYRANPIQSSAVVTTVPLQSRQLQVTGASRVASQALPTSQALPMTAAPTATMTRRTSGQAGHAGAIGATSRVNVSDVVLLGDGFGVRNTGKELGRGANGQIFLGEMVGGQFDGHEVAIKTGLGTPNQVQAIQEEARILRTLQGQGAYGIPHFFGLGHKGHGIWLVMQLLPYGDLRKKVPRGHKLQVPQIAMLADKVFRTLDSVQQSDLVHCDVKADNFMLGGRDLREDTILYIVDYGFTQISGKKANMIPGSPKYMSKFIMEGKHPTYRDDAISAIYMLDVLAGGDLPWDRFGADHPAILAAKQQETLEDFKAVCHDLPSELHDPIATALDYLTNRLRPNEKVDYDYLRGLFSGLRS